jgi:hypothetical protein
VIGLPANEVARIVALGAPVLCLDTCSVLDVLRDPTLDKASASNFIHAQGLFAAVASGRVVALVADQVDMEFNEHVGHVEHEARAAIARLQANIARIDAIATACGAVATTDTSHLTTHPDRALAIAKRFFAVKTCAPQSLAIPGLAWIRVSKALTPATQSKNSMKDCVVIETYLEAAARLRAAGMITPIVFQSSNTKDYTDGTASNLKSDLGAEFLALGMEYAPNFGAARHMLGL